MSYIDVENLARW